MQKNQENFKEERNMKILAVTACPSRVVHTYMLAEALKKATQAFEY